VYLPIICLVIKILRALDPNEIEEIPGFEKIVYHQCPGVEKRLHRMHLKLLQHVVITTCTV